MADFLTYANIQTGVQDMVDDDDTAVLSIIQGVINRVYHDINTRFKKGDLPARWLVDYDESQTTTHATRSTVLTASLNVERILAMSVDNQPCTPISWQELENVNKEYVNSPEYWWGTSNESRPTRFYHKKAYTSVGAETNTILWFLLPDAAYSFRHWYEKRVSILTGTEVPLLPPWSHPALIYGTLEQLALLDIRVKSGPWSTLYEGLINDLETFNANFNLVRGKVEPFGQ